MLRSKQMGSTCTIMYVYRYMVLTFDLYCFRINLKDMRLWLPRVNYKISNSKLRDKYQVCLSNSNELPQQLIHKQTPRFHAREIKYRNIDVAGDRAEHARNHVRELPSPLRVAHVPEAGSTLTSPRLCCALRNLSACRCELRFRATTRRLSACCGVFELDRIQCQSNLSIAAKHSAKL